MLCLFFVRILIAVLDFVVIRPKKYGMKHILVNILDYIKILIFYVLYTIINIY